MAPTEHEKIMARSEYRRSYWAYLDKRIPELHKKGTDGSNASRQAKAEYHKGYRA
jgi:hypothetical protein